MLNGGAEWYYVVVMFKCGGNGVAFKKRTTSKPFS
jgi:hypothetical protein